MDGVQTEKTDKTDNTEKTENPGKTRQDRQEGGRHFGGFNLVAKRAGAPSTERGTQRKEHREGKALKRAQR